MDYDEHYFVLDNRLASFQGPQPISRRRPSTAASKKVASWPHRSPAPEDLARAGFFFNPQPSNPDNVRCFLCHKDLDGWEEEDDPLQEHLKHSSSCGWAICAAIELELGEVANEDPRLPYMLDARKATFAGLWPYESKKGWKCKTKQLAEAGWKYTPTLESDDNTTCTYCQLALDGWESGDKPLDEHQRRSPNCPFFVLTRNPLKKQPRGKAARTSKVANSRLSVQSVQSVVTTTSDNQSLADPDESILTTATATTAQGRKSAAASSRARKTTTGTTAKGRKPRGKKEEPIVIEDSILEDPVPEPVQEAPAAQEFVEDPSILEVAVPAPAAKAPAKAARGKKRASEQAQSAPAPARSKKRTSEEIEPVDNAEAEIEAPAPKKRVTRVRASNNSVSASTSNDYAMFNPTTPDVDEADIEAELRALEQDMEVDQQSAEPVQQEPEQEIQVPKKGRKAAGTRKVSKQTARKAKEAPVGEVAQPEPEPAPEVEMHEPEPPAPVQAKPKAKGRPKKNSQVPQPPPPPPQDDEMEEDELHEDSFVSIVSTNTIVRESEQPVTAKSKAKTPKTVTAVPVPVPVSAAAPPPVPAHGPEPLAEAASAAPAPKRGRGRPSKKSMDSVRSSIGNTSQASITSTGSFVPSKITHIPPPSLPGMAIAAPDAAVKAPVEKRGKALPPLPKKRLSLRDIEEREMREQQARKQALEEKARKEEALREEAHRQEALRQEALRQEALRQEAARQEAARQEALKQEALKKEALKKEALRQERLRQEALKQEATEQEAMMQEALRQEALRQEEEDARREEELMEEQLQREQLQKEQMEKEQRKMQQAKKQPPKKQSARQSREEQESRLSVAPATPRKLSPVMSAKQATISPSPSLQSSDAENQPPSSRQASNGKTMPQVSHVPIPSFPAPPARQNNGNVTPIRESPSKRIANGNTLGGLRSTLPWTSVDVDTIFELNKENGENGEKGILEGLLRKGTELTTPEKAMSVEEFIYHNASQAERLLWEDCEAMVNEFEQQGSRAMRVLESLEVAE